MKYRITAKILLFMLLLSVNSWAQKAGDGVIQGKITAASDGSGVIGATVCEIDVTNRLVSVAATDVNGNYVLKIKSPQNTITISALGYKKQARPINNSRVINIVMQESSVSINEVVVKGVKKHSEGGYSIPSREIGSAMQTLDAKEFEGLQVSSIDEALQGRIAGLDIVSNSSDPGSGSSMRIRGVTSINGSSEPLIVVNGVPYEAEVDANFDYANSNSEQYANLLSINPDDILEITVLKDAAASAIWGSKGANGVLMITTKKGVSGKTKAEYTYRYTRTVQPKGMNMLDGDNFTMLMKEAYLNPYQDDTANDLDEYNYDTDNPYYEEYNNNTDWVDEVTQVGNIHDNYLTLSGGGERATYRVSAGMLKQNGTIIGQELSRLTSRAYLEYTVSNRIKFISDFSLTNSDNYKNYVFNFGTDDSPNEDLSILAIAYRKMPNVSVYEQDSNGNNTSSYFNIPTDSELSDDQKYLVNPVALARLATNRVRSYRLLPTFRLQYDLLDPAKTMLRYSMYVSFDVNDSNTKMYLPQEATNYAWNNKRVNRTDESESESMTIYSDQNIAYQPRFENSDHSFLLYGSFQVSSGHSTSQGSVSYSNPSNAATDASNDSYWADAGTSHSTWRSLAFMVRSHYSYKSRYIVDATLRRDGSTKFGENNRFGNFPGITLKWIISDEPFMARTKNWLSMLAIRPAWGISGNQPSAEYLYQSKYKLYDSYAGMTAVKPSTLQLSNLKWETTSSFNYGIDLGLFNDRLVFDVNFYNKRTKDLLFEDVALPLSSGFSSLEYINGGTMDNDGWEINLYANRVVNSGNFSMDFRFNLGNYKNTLISLNDQLLASYNSDFDYSNGNGTYLTRVQEGNSFGSIYGYRFKGVYQYDDYTENGTSPYAIDENGSVITDANGDAKPMYYAYGSSSQYRFRGGDAIYEDINNDGSIDKQDIVYLGNSNPKISGGFGPTFHYKGLSCNLFFNFRYGNKIVNKARMYAENMYSDNNQSIAVNWRWRKDGDVTSMPRALYNYGYNWLGSDRYVEDGSFLRLKYMTFNYSIPPKWLKPYRLSKLSTYLTFNNVFVLTKYTGVDPEVSYGSLGLSTDNSSTPRTKDVTLGISIGF
jgi:TonB-linked SusC/RagA family outer membrane protein